jgi:acyl-CoA dehydrogenase
MIDFSVPPDTEAQRRRIVEFIAAEVIPRESLAFEQGVDDHLRITMQAAAREAGVWAPQASSAIGGGGFDFTSSAVLLEAAGFSLLGPMAMNCAAPDEGNIHLLDQVATERQRERYLLPLVAGDVRSCFAMTEPPPGAGSDPQALQTTARRVQGGWSIEGKKWLITGAAGAAFAIVMARNLDGSGATMFIVDAENPGWHVGKHIRTIDESMVGGHCEVVLGGCFVPDKGVLGTPGNGFSHAQQRLVPARLTHCMRWLGAASRAHSIAMAHSVDRELFGTQMTNLGMAQQLIADNEIDLWASRAVLWHACWVVVQGEKGMEESSRAKVFVSEATGRVVDRSVQLAGGMGTSVETVLGRIYADIRAFRIYDGASEVHRMSLAKSATRRAVEAPSGGAAKTESM